MRQPDSREPNKRKRPELKPVIKPVSIQALSLETLIALARMKPGFLLRLCPDLQARVEARLKWTG